MNRAERRRREKQAQKAARGKGQSAAPAVTRPAPIADQTAEIEAAIQEHRAGRLDEAEQRYRHLHQADPGNPVPLNLLGILLTQRGDFDGAMSALTQAVTLNPEFAEAHCSVGNTLKAMGRTDEALSHYQTALKLKPEYVNAHFNMGTVLLECARLDEALAHLERTVALQPNFADAHNNRGNVLNKMERFDEAAAAFCRALELNPNAAEYHNNLGNVYLDTDNPEQAQGCFETALKLNPQFPDAHLNLANALRFQDRFTQAIAHAREALRLKPDLAEAHNCLGAIHQDMGDLDAAKRHFRDAIALAPGFGPPYRHLVGLQKHHEHDAEIQAMEHALAAPDTADVQKSHIAFALGKAFEDLGQPDRAFEHYVQGNALKRASLAYDPGDADHFFAGIKKLFSAEFIANHADAANTENRPIFIIGMPRSGTSLVEQILASHPDVYGAGELTTLTKIVAAYAHEHGGIDVPSALMGISSADLKRMGEAYQHALRHINEDSRFITDKMPENFFNVGIIKTALPHAGIIHCRRNPADNGLSIFKTYFTSQGHLYAYDLAEIGHHFTLYADLMDHWQTVVPGFAHEVRYEDMINAPENTIRALLDHCGLTWDDTCLDFSNTKRPVKTASAAQVRQPIYKTSVQAWRKFERQLQPMIDAFAPSLRNEIG